MDGLKRSFNQLPLASARHQISPGGWGSSRVPCWLNSIKSFYPANHDPNSAMKRNLFPYEPHGIIKRIISTRIDRDRSGLHSCHFASTCDETTPRTGKSLLLVLVMMIFVDRKNALFLESSARQGSKRTPKYGKLELPLSLQHHGVAAPSQNAI